MATRLQPTLPNAPAVAWLALAFGGVAAALVHAPARWLAEPVRQATKGQVELLAPQGTVWSGQAWLTLTGGENSRDRVTLPSPVTWGVRWPTGLTLNAPCCLQGPLTVRWVPGWSTQAFQIPAHHSQWPAGLLTGLGAPWNTLQLHAQLALRTPGITWLWQADRGARWQGSATLDVLDASSRLSTVRPLGSYRISVDWPEGQASAGDPSMQLSTLNGSLLLSGQGQWLGGRLRLQGEAAAAPGREDALNNLMNLLGRRVNGRTQIKIG
jgi:general secretion pathway protein N